MSRRTSGDRSNAIEILDPNNLEGGHHEEEVIEGSAVTPAANDDFMPDFMHTDDFRRLLVDLVMVDTLVAMRWLDKKWHKVVEKKLIEFEDEPFGEIIVHGGKDLPNEEPAGRKERMKQVTKVVFLLDITKVGHFTCYYASNLVVVDIPEGITSIGDNSFFDCSSLEEIKFPKSLRSIGVCSFGKCSSLKEVDLLHTNVKELGSYAFGYCRSLREMKVPDSLQKLGYSVFYNCSKLVPSTINVNNDNAVVAYLRSIQNTTPTMCNYLGCTEPAPLKCSRCKQVKYCSKDHQRRDWKAHKTRCEVPPAHSPPLGQYNMSMFWSIAVILFALIVRFAWRGQDEEEGGGGGVFVWVMLCWILWT
ncbi:hypothetical protein TrCOL_g13530 [Triparma columacea]|uniref:MYND-type domain-containing protein n=1 Tax=Triparma columacea TaxID=722753 RepID=A0A9W7GF61_9STRA|nr:hypothetical protein TrCOL_g13530 [Triparma columacea]